MEKKVLESFKLWFAAVREYNRHPSKFSGRPRMPKYVKGDETSFAITNQDTVVYGKELKPPKTKERLCLWDGAAGRLKRVEIIPYYDIYKICVSYETEGFTDKILDRNRILALDLGIDNFLASSNNCGLSPFIVKGKAVKSKNAYIMKESVRMKSELMKSQGLNTSRRLQRLWRKRNNYFKEFAAKISSYLVKYCMKNNIGTVVVGKGRDWEQESDVDKSNTPKFVLFHIQKSLQK